MLKDLEFRLVIEPEAARLAAERRTQDDLVRMAEALDAFETAYRVVDITHHHDFLFHEGKVILEHLELVAPYA